MTKKKNTLDKTNSEAQVEKSLISQLKGLEKYKLIPLEKNYFIYNSKGEDQDLSREEQIKLAQERIEQLKNLTEKMNTAQGLHELEFESWLKRRALNLREGKDQINNFETTLRFERMESLISELKSDLSEIQEECFSIKKSFIDYVSNSVFHDVPRRQFLEVEVYLDTNEPDSILDAYNYLKLALDNLGYTYELELPAVFGSWYKRFLAKSKNALTSEEVTSRLKEIEYAFEVKVLKDQSEVDKNQSEAVLNILKGIESTPNAVIRIGSLLVIKVTNPSTNVPSIQVRTLAIKELHFLNKNPHLTNHPADLLSALAAIPPDPDKLLN